VGSADLRRAYTAPFRIVPEGGKVGCNNVLPSTSKSDCCDVFQEDEARSYLINGARKVGPDARLGSVDDAESLPGERDIGAGEATSDDIHRAAPRSAIEGSGIAPHRRFIQGEISHARNQ
jgi:hypothetical protein